MFSVMITVIVVHNRRAATAVVRPRVPSLLHRLALLLLARQDPSGWRMTRPLLRL